MNYKIEDREEAIRNFQRFYFTGKPCRSGHIAQRYVSTGHCRECQKAATRGHAGKVKLLRSAFLAPSGTHILVVRMPSKALADTVRQTAIALGGEIMEKPVHALPPNAAPPGWKPNFEQLHPGVRMPTDEPFLLPANRNLGE